MEKCWRNPIDRRKEEEDERKRKGIEAREKRSRRRG
jgi:hypothetical protein